MIPPFDSDVADAATGSELTDYDEVRGYPYKRSHLVALHKVYGSITTRQSFLFLGLSSIEPDPAIAKPHEIPRSRYADPESKRLGDADATLQIGRLVISWRTRLDDDACHRRAGSLCLLCALAARIEKARDRSPAKQTRPTE